MNNFMLLLLLASVLTGLITQAFKVQLGDHCPHANILSGIVSVIVAIAIVAANAIYFGVPVDHKYIVASIALILLSWLCAMLGYDKVREAILSVKNGKNIDVTEEKLLDEPDDGPGDKEDNTEDDHK